MRAGQIYTSKMWSLSVRVLGMASSIGVIYATTESFGSAFSSRYLQLSLLLGLATLIGRLGEDFVALRTAAYIKKPLDSFPVFIPRFRFIVNIIISTLSFISLSHLLEVSVVESALDPLFLLITLPVGLILSNNAAVLRGLGFTNISSTIDYTFTHFYAIVLLFLGVTLSYEPSPLLLVTLSYFCQLLSLCIFLSFQRKRYRLNLNNELAKQQPQHLFNSLASFVLGGGFVIILGALTPSIDFNELRLVERWSSIPLVVSPLLFPIYARQLASLKHASWGALREVFVVSFLLGLVSAIFAVTMFFIATPGNQPIFFGVLLMRSLAVACYTPVAAYLTLNKASYQAMLNGVCLLGLLCSLYLTLDFGLVVFSLVYTLTFLLQISMGMRYVGLLGGGLSLR